MVVLEKARLLEEHVDWLQASTNDRFPLRRSLHRPGRLAHFRKHAN